MKSAIAIISIFVLMFSMLPLNSTQATAEGWSAVLVNDVSPSNIRSNGITLVNTPIKLDSSGNVHIVYNKDWQIYHVFNNSGYFNETAYGNVLGATPSFDIDNSGTLHIAYYIQSEFGDSDIYYYKEGSSPIKVTNGGVHSLPSIAVDSNGYAHIVFFTTVKVTIDDKEVSRFRVMYTNNIGGSFMTPIELNYTGYSNLAYPSIVIDKNDVPHIICYGQNSTTGYVYTVYSNYSSGVLSTPIKVNETLVSPTISAPIPDITVDDNNVLHIVCPAADLDHYTDGNPDFNYTAIYYLNYSNGVFSTPVKVSSGIDSASHPSIAVDKNSFVHIAFSGRNSTWDEADLDIFYTDNTGGNFSSIIRVFNSEHSDFFPHIEVDDNGYSHIVFYQTLNDLSLSKVYYLTDSPYAPYPIERGSPLWIWVAIGVGVGGAVVALGILGWKKYKQLEKELEEEIRRRK